MRAPRPRPWRPSPPPGPDGYPAIVKLWRANWEEFILFLAFPPEVRRVIYTTNLIGHIGAEHRIEAVFPGAAVGREARQLACSAQSRM